jgi:nucleotide-binding universal stress UspA family protein
VNRTREILVAIDGVDGSQTVVAFAARLAKQFSASIICYDAVDVAGEAEPVFAEARGLVLQRDEPTGSPAGAILDAAQAAGVSAIVIGTYDYPSSARILLARVAVEVVRRAKLPVIVVPAAGGMTCATDLIAAIVVAFDESESSGAALDFALDFARPSGTRVTLVHAVEEDADARSRATADELLMKSAARFKRAGAEIDTVLLEGPAAPSVLEYVNNHPVDLLAIGAHAGHGLERPLLGSVAADVIRGSTVPVAVLTAGAR